MKRLGKRGTWFCIRLKFTTRFAQYRIGNHKSRISRRQVQIIWHLVHLLEIVSLQVMTIPLLEPLLVEILQAETIIYF